MKFIRSKLIISSVIIIAALMTGCSGFDTDKANIRITQASTGPSAVDIRANSAVAAPDLDYSQNTGLVSINAGIYDVATNAIVPDGNIEDVISFDEIAIAKDHRYTVLAISDIADMNISEFIARESAATPGID